SGHPPLPAVGPQESPVPALMIPFPAGHVKGGSRSLQRRLQALPQLHGLEFQLVAAILLRHQADLVFRQASGQGRLRHVRGGSGAQGWKHHTPPVLSGALPNQNPQGQILPGWKREAVI
ncbi:Integrase core domain, partial [Dysosmobacter welbionis]